MDAADRLASARFPRASRYHPEWVLTNASGGANALQLAEWLSEVVEIRPDMRVLDLGCGKASTSIFLAREFGCEVWACDLWMAATDNQKRIVDAGLAGKVFPLHLDARMLPFAAEFFDLVVCIDAYYYFGADPLYLNYLANFVKVDGRIAVAGAGLTREVDTLPEHLKEWWTQDLWSLQSAEWLRRHWAKTGIVEVEAADTMEDGWKVWLDWHRAVAPDNATEIAAIEADQGRTIGYVRAVGRRLPGVKLEEYCWPDPLKVMISNSYEKKPLLRSNDAL
jgi:cyclopropane fatty-acyl-phospholipid synthase-like methyltransferase